MRQVRRGVFETNSSSTHSLTICTQEEYDKWLKGELLFDSWNSKFAENISLSEYDKQDAQTYYNNVKGAYWKEWSQLSDEEVNSWYTKYANEHLRDKKSYGLQTYLEYCNYNSLERFTEHYTSPSGDKLVIFGKYGYD